MLPFSGDRTRTTTEMHSLILAQNQVAYHSPNQPEKINRVLCLGSDLDFPVSLAKGGCLGFAM